MKDVGHHKYLTRRPGTANWQFRARVPLDLAPLFGRREVTKSLGTTDLVEAKRRVRDEADAFDKQCHALRDRAVTDGRATIGNVALSSLSEAAIQEMALAWFDTLTVEREHRHAAAVPLDRDQALITLDQDEADLTDPNDLGLDAAYQIAVRLLRANDVRLVRRQLDPICAAGSRLPFVVAREDAPSAQFRRLLALLRRGPLEDIRRSRARLAELGHRLPELGDAARLQAGEGIPGATADHPPFLLREGGIHVQHKRIGVGPSSVTMKGMCAPTPTIVKPDFRSSEGPIVICRQSG